MRVRRPLLIAVLLGAGVVACTEETIVVATVPAEATGPGGPGGKPEGKRARCVSTSDCESGMFCERHRCDEPAGSCEPYPVSCNDDEDPVCGCNGITYWNDCLRRAAGVAGAVPGECVDTPPCDDLAKACPTGARCARLIGFEPLGPECRPTPGRCWVLPATCPPPVRSNRWNECGPPDKGLRCADTCSAIRSGKPFARAVMCE